MKPHVVYLLWPALLLWVVTRRRWRVAIGFGVALTTLTAISLAMRPTILVDFLTTLEGSQPRHATSTIGTLLRFLSHGLLGEDHLELVAIPPIAGLLWLGARWTRRADHWQWTEELPRLVIVSLALAPFAWIYDQVLAVLALVQIVAMAERSGRPLSRAVIAGLVAFDVVVLAMNVARVDAFWYVWTPFALLGLHARAAPVPPLTTSREAS